MFNNRDISILKTLTYADVFEFPLTFNELRKYAIADTHSTKDLRAALKRLSPIISRKGRFFFIHGRGHIVAKRIVREKESEVKLRRAKFFAKILACIPTIEMIGVSGSLAMRNAQADDDIDFFIITQRNALWISRLAAYILLTVYGVKRQRGQKYAKDTICMNMFVSRNNLATAEKNRNLYVAHEIAQVVPLMNRNDTYERFIQANSWVTSFLPSSISKKISAQEKISESYFERIMSFVLYPFESICYRMQLYYMKEHRRHEFVSRSRAEFYPYRTKNPILELYYLRLTYTLSMCSQAQGIEEILASKNLN